MKSQAVPMKTRARTIRLSDKDDRNVEDIRQAEPIPMSENQVISLALSESAEKRRRAQKAR